MFVLGNPNAVLEGDAIEEATSSAGDAQSKITEEPKGGPPHGNDPRFLVWLLAGTSIVMGAMMLFGAMFMRKMSARFTDAGGKARTT